jgi:glycosyltransferase involved in cell wall biosynthesis
MSYRHRILLQTNPPLLKTGLAENGRTLAKWLWKTGKYEFAYYCTQGTSVIDPTLEKYPWKSYGCIPANQQLINELNQNMEKARAANYGAYNIDNVMKEFKPTIWLGSDDAWSFPKSDYIDKSWYNQINSILHITVDSLPVIEQAYEQAKFTPNYFLWSKFALKEMHAKGKEYEHIKCIYGSMDTADFCPITEDGKKQMRQRFGIKESTIIFLFVFRNQLRKQAVRILEAFAEWKKENPEVDAKLLFHTSWSEKGMGWDFPRLMTYFGVEKKDVLCTYVCKNCGHWHVRDYDGEDITCPACGVEKIMVTASIMHGVSSYEMKYLYGLTDACINAHSSGGLEYNAVQSLLCGKPLAVTNYASGQDFCEQPFVYPLTYHFYDEPGTCFLKSATDVSSIKAFMRKIYKSSKKELQIIGEQSRQWAVNTFSIETIGKQWEDLFDSLPPKDWSSIVLEYKPKNPNHPFPGYDMPDIDFITNLYTNILHMDEHVGGEGHKHWQAKLKEGMKREDIYNYFISVANDENNKNQPQKDFESILDKTGKKRGLIVIKESIGDVALVTSLFKSFHEQHPNTDLYVATSQQYFPILEGNEYIHKVLPYLPMMESEMGMIGSGSKTNYFDYFYHAAISTQRLLNYLSHVQPAFDLDHE